MTATIDLWRDFNTAADARADFSDDIDVIRSALLDRVEAVLLYLYPQGRIRGAKFYVGDVDGSPGKSLIVELGGPRRGLWTDFATGDGGDLIDLWARAQGRATQQDFPHLVDEIRQWLGFVTPTHHQARGAHRAIPMDELGPYTAKWDYQSADGELIACVYRFDPEPGCKEFRPWDVRARMWRAPDPRPLYNQPAIRQASTVILVEGEKCVPRR